MQPDQDSPQLTDVWDKRGAVQLDGWLERNRFSPLLTAIACLVFAFILFQVLSIIFAILLVVLREGSVAGAFPDGFSLEIIFERHPRMLLIANSMGQVLGLALPALFLGWLASSSESRSFLRFRQPDRQLFGMGMLGLLVLLPIVQWLGILNERLPIPEEFRQMERVQMELIERILMADLGLWFNLLALAIVPSLCEEVLFRGYVQRQFERVAGVALTIILIGVLFGAYHLRLTQVLPLSALGIYMCYLTWRTGSLLPAIGVHFLNNAVAVGIAAYVARRPDMELSQIENIPVPFYVVLLCLLLLFLLVRAMTDRAGVLLETGEWRAGKSIEM